MKKNSDKIKKDNKKALPAFLIIILCAAVFGGVIGYFSSGIGYSETKDTIINAVMRFLQIITPYISVISIAAFVLPAFIIFRRAGKLSDSWDGEDEVIPDKIENLINRAMLLINLGVLNGFLGISCLIIVNAGLGGSLIGLFTFILSETLLTVLQQRFVDLMRSINPEKQGSVYDMKFQKKWYDSCDEAEKKLIGEAAYHSFRITSNSCIIMWCLTLFAHIAFGTGIFPVIAVLIITGISQISYIHQAIKLSRK